MPLDDTISTGQAGHITDHQTIAAQLNTLTGPHAAATTDVFTARVTGDTVDRFVVNADGKIEWGPGNGALDTNLYRSAADTLKTDDLFLAAGRLGVGGSIGAMVDVIPDSAGRIGAIIRGAASQTGNLTEWQNSAGTVLARVDAVGGADFQPTAITSGASRGYGLYVSATAATHSPLLVRGAASQSANLQEWQNSAGTLLLSVTASGSIAATGGSVGFYGTTPITKQSGVAVTAAGIHAALVNLGLIAA